MTLDVSENCFRIYVAGPRASAARANRVALTLRDRGHRPVSRWHVDAKPLVDPLNPAVRAEVLYDNTEDLVSADLILALMDEGLPRATYAEIGYALALDKKIIWVGSLEDEARACIYDSHPRVMRAKSDAESLEIVDKLWEMTENNISSFRSTEPLRILSTRMRYLVSAAVESMMKRTNSPSHEATMHLVSTTTGDSAFALANSHVDELSPLLWLKYAVDVVAGSMILTADATDESVNVPSSEVN